MSGSHPKLEAWDMAIHEIIKSVELSLETTFGQGVELRRNRPSHGSTANPQMDGMFNLGLVFTPGYGSELGRGYWMDLEILSKEAPNAETKSIYIDFCKNCLEKALQEKFPDRGLRLQLDGGRWKLVGDFGLGLV